MCDDPGNPVATAGRTLADAPRDATKASTEAEAFKQRTMAEAARDTTKLNTEAETARLKAIAEADAHALRAEASGTADAARDKADGDAHAAKMVAEADALASNARADALSAEHQGLIAANKLVDMLPALVEASASASEGARLTIHGGAPGVNEFTTWLAAQGLSIYTALQSLLAKTANGSSEHANGQGNGREASSAEPAQPIVSDTDETGRSRRKGAQ